MVDVVRCSYIQTGSAGHGQWPQVNHQSLQCLLSHWQRVLLRPSSPHLYLRSKLLQNRSTPLARWHLCQGSKGSCINKNSTTSTKIVTGYSLFNSRAVFEFIYLHFVLHFYISHLTIYDYSWAMSWSIGVLVMSMWSRAARISTTSGWKRLRRKWWEW